MSLYQFKVEDAERFASSTGIKNRKRGNQLELMFCPYCRSQNDKWTFGISLDTGQFECKRSSCKAKGNMIILSKDFDFSLGREVDAYYRSVDYSKKHYKDFANSHRKIEVRDKAIEYLKQRGISEEITRRYEITTLPDNEDILAFPFKDIDGSLTFIKYRNMNYVKGKGNKEWCEKNCRPILFGMNHCNSEISDRLIITEGQIDSLSVTMANFDNAVSVPTGCNGFTWVPYCYDFISKFRTIVVMGDCENGKITLTDEISKRWPEKVRTVRVEDYRGCKDANELLQKYGISAIKQAIDNANPAECPLIKPLAKVKHVDIMATEAIKTGMKKLDEILDGGFRMGQLAILTGRRGEGKSTIASMWGARALDQGYNCYFYSGELPDFFFKNWMDCQIIGKSIQSASEEDALNKWYGNRAFIYDDSQVATDEYPNLLELIKTSIIQYNCRFILLDNLMTAIDDDLSSDLYRQQSKFVRELSKISKNYNVFILLIAHPRKTFGELNNDSISGSSQITDRADLTLIYGRPEKKKEDSDNTDTIRELSIHKNRLTGKETKEPIKLVYDKNSRRVADSTVDLFNIKFDWKDEFLYAEDDEVPF